MSQVCYVELCDHYEGDVYGFLFFLQARPTPAHLTSVQAEQILATACENESDNAKRMRVGLEPVSQPMPTLPAATVSCR